MRKLWTSGVLLIAACTGDDGNAVDTMETSGVPLPATDGSDTDAVTSGDTTAGDATAGDTTDGDGLCETIFCGEPIACCAAGEDCAAGQCVPACDSGVRCGRAQDICCNAGEVCLATECVAPGDPCLDSFDCDFGQFCEPTLGQCLPQSNPVVCELEPDFEDIAVTEEWAWTTDNVISIPIVVDLDGDEIPEVIVNTTQMDGGSWPAGEVVVLNGQTGAELWRIDHVPAMNMFGSHGRSTLAAADVSGDGLPDIIYAGRDAGGSLIHAVDGQGQLLWSSHDPGGADHRLNVTNGAPALANLDADPESEIVFGAAILDDDGTVVWDQGGNGAVLGTNGGYSGGISAIADLDGDGTPEIVSGRQAWSIDWQDVGGVPTVTLAPFWDSGVPDGYPAIADLDGDGTPEVVLVASGNVYVLNGQTGQLWCGLDPTEVECLAAPASRTQPIAIPGGGLGGPPTISDFDGDGRPEIAAAGGSSYSVYDLARPGEDIVVPMGDPAPALGAAFVRWSQATQDQSSNVTGSSVFDFQGDGIAEVIYADECYVRVYSGLDGQLLLEQENSTGTIHEYPLVVDVDADGNSEILVVANETHTGCDGIPGYTYRRGVFVLGDTFDQWVLTRRVWNQHAYHVTNVSAAGLVPGVEVDNWSDPGLNNYRQNAQGEGVFNAPDLAVELSVGLGDCLGGQLILIATVRNIGSIGVPAGVDVTLYTGTDATGMVIGSQPTPNPLLPGAQVALNWNVPFPPGSADLAFYVEVDGGDAMAAGEIVECDESNNTASTETAACPMPG
jgi:hypothetical protein